MKKMIEATYGMDLKDRITCVLWIFTNDGWRELMLHVCSFCENLG